LSILVLIPCLFSLRILSFLLHILCFFNYLLSILFLFFLHLCSISVYFSPFFISVSHIFIPSFFIFLFYFFFFFCSPLYAILLSVIPLRNIILHCTTPVA
jgi:hypothetical protein